MNGRWIKKQGQCGPLQKVCYEVGMGLREGMLGKERPEELDEDEGTW